MKHNFLFFLSFVLIITFSYSQANVVKNSSRAIETDFISPSDRKEEAEGSPYMSDEFILARINKSDKIYSVRYDAYQDLMEVQQGEDSKILLLDKEKEYLIVINDGSMKTYQTATYEDGKRGFVISVWSDGEHGLYAKESIKLNPFKEASSSYESDTPAKFVRKKDTYYMRNSIDGKLIELSTSKKKFFATFKEKAKAVQAYAKKEKLKIGKKDDLIKIMRFYFASV